MSMTKSEELPEGEAVVGEAAVSSSISARLAGSRAWYRAKSLGIAGDDATFIAEGTDDDPRMGFSLRGSDFSNDDAF